MELVIVTGMSGAGKTVTLKMFEDLGYYCVDNLPIPLMESFVQLMQKDYADREKLAIGVDIRGGSRMEGLEQILTLWRQEKREFKILFLESSDEILIKRYKETRRSHPLSGAGRIDEGILEEREALSFLKKESDYIIDTSRLLTRDLRQQLEQIFLNRKPFASLFVTVLSFGFKYGIPSDADLVFDVRFLPNPYYVDDLKKRTGLEQAVQDYVMQGDTGEIFLNRLCELLDFLIPNYVLEGKNQLVIAVGCTGGKHRSVTIAEKLYQHLSSREQLGLKVEHRDIDNDSRIRD